MTCQKDRRRSLRLLVRGEYTVGFTLKGEVFSGIEVINLSVGGCFVVAPAKLASSCQQGALLHRFHLQHPHLPSNAFVAQVRYAVSSDMSSSGALPGGLGLAFLWPPSDVASALSTLLDLALGPE